MPCMMYNQPSSTVHVHVIYRQPSPTEHVHVTYSFPMQSPVNLHHRQKSSWSLLCMISRLSLVKSHGSPFTLNSAWHCLNWSHHCHHIRWGEGAWGSEEKNSARVTGGLLSTESPSSKTRGAKQIIWTRHRWANKSCMRSEQSHQHYN